MLVGGLNPEVTVKVRRRVQLQPSMSRRRVPGVQSLYLNMHSRTVGCLKLFVLLVITNTLEEERHNACIKRERQSMAQKRKAVAEARGNMLEPDSSPASKRSKQDHIATDRDPLGKPGSRVLHYAILRNM